MYSGILHTHTHTHTHTDWQRWFIFIFINYMHIWRDEFLRLAWKKLLILSDEHHTVTSSTGTVSGPWKKNLVVQRSLFLWKICGRFCCKKWSEVVWMDGRQWGVITKLPPHSLGGGGGGEGVDNCHWWWQKSAPPPPHFSVTTSPC